MITKRSTMQKEALKLNNLILELIDKNYLTFIKKKNFVIFITEKNKKKGKSKKKTGFKYFHYSKIRYKEIDCFYKHLKKTLSSWKFRKDGAQEKRSKTADNISSISLIIRNTD